MEALAIVALVDNIISFVDFSSKLISKSVELHRSSSGALVENINIETAAKHLGTLSAELQRSANATADVILVNLCRSCSVASNELLVALEEVKVKDH